MSKHRSMESFILPHPTKENSNNLHEKNSFFSVKMSSTAKSVSPQHSPGLQRKYHYLNPEFTSPCPLWSDNGLHLLRVQEYNSIQYNFEIVLNLEAVREAHRAPFTLTHQLLILPRLLCHSPPLPLSPLLYIDTHTHTHTHTHCQDNEVVS